MQFLPHALFLAAAGCNVAPHSQGVTTHVRSETRPIVDEPSVAAARDTVAEIWGRHRVSDIIDDTGRAIGFVSAARSYSLPADAAITKRLDALCSGLDHAGFWTAVDEWLADPAVRQRVMGEGDSVTSPALKARDLLEIATIAAWRFHRQRLPESSDPAAATAGFTRAWQLLGLVVHEPNVLTLISARATTVLFLRHCVTVEAATSSPGRVSSEMVDALDSYPWPLLDIDAPMIAQHKAAMLAAIEPKGDPHAARVVTRYVDDLTAAIAMPEPHRWRRIHQLVWDAPEPELTGVPDETWFSPMVFANRRLPAALAQSLRYVLAIRHFERLTGRLPQSVDDLGTTPAASRWMSRVSKSGLVSLAAAPDHQAITLSIDGIVDPDEVKQLDLATADDRDLRGDADVRITVTRSPESR